MNIKFIKILRNIIYLFKILVFSPTKFNFLKKSEILVYDPQGSEPILSYFKDYTKSFLYVRGEQKNFWTLVFSVFMPSFWRINPLAGYEDAHIYQVKPKIIITFIDNNNNFLRLATRAKNVKTILIQNGMRNLDHFNNFSCHSFKVDYKLLFNNSIAKYYSKYISGETDVIGSFLNNKYYSDININADNSNDVLFISQWRPGSKSEYFNIFPDNPKLINYEKYYLSERKILPIIYSWCINNNKNLKICCWSLTENNFENEKLFFSNIIDLSKVDCVMRIDQSSSYRLIDSSSIVVHIDSTLGYESLARGKKTATITSRANDWFILGEFRKFGFLEEFDDVGPCWSTSSDSDHIYRILDYLNDISYSEWSKLNLNIKSKILPYDSDNNKFKEIISSILK